MRGLMRAVAAVAVLSTAGVALAQDAPDGDESPFQERAGWRGMGRVVSPGDRAAFLDARVAALRAGLKLSAEQEKLWPPVEEAIRGLARQRMEARSARRDRFVALRDEAVPDLPAQLRFAADQRTAAAAALGRLADAMGPLHAALDDAQKRRLAVLTRLGEVGARRRR